MDKERAAAIAALGARGEQIKTNSAEYLWVCCAIDKAGHELTGSKSAYRRSGGTRR